ncbi:MAG: DUF92 domain-containing protein [Candidatus Bilamarchaeaceae archaeon]
MVAMLDRQGAMLAFLLGILLVVFGSVQHLILILVFLFLAILATKYEYYRKKNMGIYEHERGWENVLSNGLGPLLFAMASPFVGLMPFICSVAAITADKFASELGVLEGKPLDIFTLKPVKEGTSGAVSALGTVVSFAGALLIGLSAMLLFGIGLNAALLVGLCGFLGGVVDSVFGVLEEKGIGTKGTTNFICSVAGGIFGILFFGAR